MRFLPYLKTTYIKKTLLTLSGVAIGLSVPWASAYSLIYGQQDALPSPYAAPSVQATSYILMDYDSGQIIAESAPDELVEPASLTKMMSVYVMDYLLDNEQLHWDDLVTVSANAWRTGGSRMFIEVDSQVSVEDLMRGIIIQSGNDASVAIAEHIAGSEAAFADMMNEQAKRLNMHNSNFKNATGLPDPEHLTTTRDFALLAAALIRDYPDSYDMYSEREFTYNNISQHNRNRLLWQFNGADGIKTGHTQNAGYCLVASAVRDDMRLISVVAGSPSEAQRTSDSTALLNYGFRNFTSEKLFLANEAIDFPRLWMGQQRNVPVGLSDDLFITLPRNQQPQRIEITWNYENLIAPIAAYQEVATLNIYYDDATIAQRPLLTLQEVPKAGMWSRVTDYMRLKWKKWFGKTQEMTTVMSI